MITKNKKIKKSKLATPLFTVLAISIVALGLLLILQNKAENKIDKSIKNKSENTQQRSVELINKNNSEISIDDGSAKTSNLQAFGELGRVENSKNENQNSSAEANSDANILNKKSYDIVCTQATGQICLIKQGNPFVSAFDKDIFASMILEGEKIEVEEIAHSILFDQTFAFNQINGADGAVIISSGISYDEQNKRVNIKIGMRKNYYDALSQEEKKSTYTMQLIRAVIFLTGDIASNYPKVYQILGGLGIWDPNSTYIKTQ
jgi:hypothetical protein